MPIASATSVVARLGTESSTCKAVYWVACRPLSASSSRMRCLQLSSVELHLIRGDLRILVQQLLQEMGAVCMYQLQKLQRRVSHACDPELAVGQRGMDK